ncbi:MAG: hypothetical protein JWR61_5806 [Ferruginibacter sp.]|nr:hypothetical protein [Ferruginibacter sp.]
MWGLTHNIEHLVIFLASLIGAFEVPRSFNALIRLQWKTRISAKVFFVTCGLTHLGLALNLEHSPFFTITDHMQAVSLVVFLVLLSYDLTRALRMIRLAFKAVQSEHGADGDRMIATVTTALRRGK